MKLFLVLVLSVCFASSIDLYDVAYTRGVIRNSMKWNDVPAKFVQLLTILNKNLFIFHCLPTKKNGNCYETPNRYCTIPQLKVDGKSIKIHVQVCKHPWKIVISYAVPLPSWARFLHDVDFEPIVIYFHPNHQEGVLKIKSSSKAKVGALSINLAKANLNIDGIFRWDCTRPRNNRTKRIYYNMDYDDRTPGLDFNKHYYKLKVSLEVKTKRFPCFCYRCSKCVDLVYTQGHVESGPESCNQEITTPLEYIKRGNIGHGRKVYIQRISQFKQRCRLVPRRADDQFWKLREIYLFYFLENPRKHEPGTRFIFAGMKKKRERGDLLRFLRDWTVDCPQVIEL